MEDIKMDHHKIIRDLTNWFNEKPYWLRKAAEILISEGGVIEESNYQFLRDLCIQEAQGEINLDPIDLQLNRLIYESEGEEVRLKLKSVGDIENINALSPRKPVDFGEENLSVIYGENGSGKSGYVRILSNICGSPNKIPLLPNTYKDNLGDQRCRVKYIKENAEKEAHWAVESGSIDDLGSISVFDENCGRIYVNEENETTYEPQILTFFSQLTDVSDKIARYMQDKIHLEGESKLPTLPEEYRETESGIFYTTLSVGTTEIQIKEKCKPLNEQEEKELLDLDRRISEQNSQKLASDLASKNEYITKIISHMTKYVQAFSDANYSEIRKLGEDFENMEASASIFAERLFKDSNLEGVGKETWKHLWEYARVYSQEIAYKDKDFPFTGDGALCVLCQQSLNDDAKERFLSFEDYVKGEAENAVTKAKTSLDVKLKSLPDILSKEEITVLLSASGLESDRLKNDLLKFHSIVLKRKNEFCQKPPFSESITPLTSVDQCLQEAQKMIQINNTLIDQYNQDAETEKRNKLIAESNNFQAQKWIYQHRELIVIEINRLKQVDLLKKSHESAGTTSLSRKKSTLSELLITQSYVDRFNQEKNKLGADGINVKLVKSGTKKGKTFHKIILINAKQKSPKNILSEGESRIISLAAFLSDSRGRSNFSPIVFDDPISSLDQSFEGYVSDYLVELSTHRQIIIFTHRTSMLVSLQNAAKLQEAKISFNHLENQSWGVGEPGDLPLQMKSPKSALNILNEKVMAKIKLQEQEDKRNQADSIRSICSNFRIILERIVEKHLLNDIVQRYRKDIQTKGKLSALSQISEEDCNKIDRLMSDYSKPLHSQPDETAPVLPELTVLQRDIADLISWLNKFTKKMNQ